MKEYKIVIDIEPTGKITADAEGFTGDACLKDIDRLLDGIAVYQEQVSKKPEAYEKAVTRRTRKTITSKKK